MPALLREFEQHEDKRLNETKQYFNMYGEKQAPVGPQWIESNERLLSKVREINVRSDLDLYVEKNRPDSDQPPPRAQYISYDGSVVQDVNGSSAGASAPVKKTKKESKIPKLPGARKKKEVPADKGTGEKKPQGTSPHPPPPVASPSTGGSHPSTSPPSDHQDPDSSDQEERPVPAVPAPNNQPKQLVTIYAYEATEENELSFAEGELIILLEKDDSGWWRGRNAKGQEGLFPSNFVDIVGEEGNSGSVEINKDFQALYDYEAEDETELTIKEGEILHVISETDGWYFGTNAQGQEGNFPSNFVEAIEPHNNV